MSRIEKLQRLDETTLRLGGVGDNWNMTWADDDKQYAGLCDGAGWPGMPQASYNSRVYAISGSPPDVTFEYLPGYPDLTFESMTPKWPLYYGFGTLAVDGRIYQYLSAYSSRSEKPATSRFIGAKLIYSDDLGVTWRNQDGSTPVRWEGADERSKDTLVFWEESQEEFSMLTILQMGRHYSLNDDGFVYVYGPNGQAEGLTNELVMFRVPKARVLDRGAYEYFEGRAPDGGATWTSEIKGRSVVHTFPSGWVPTVPHPHTWHPSVVYYPAADQYLMANWGTGVGPAGEMFGRPSYLGFWTAPHPWGPWEQVHEETAWTPVNDPGAWAYEPQVSPKWIALDGRFFWLVWSDIQQKDGKAPFYAFNVQRVEVTLR